ncbi:PLP-dependent transferase [Mongoliibacter ruber]|uniref:Cys/Met metabolism PLP-dependent enzyme n=1 Tax=Mongoliibacter ruber TaxID=1750599 RepID=A0A2T0WK37_9BACT|nr:PLP-dependent transferase [Mongoliibacter ruber]PRY87071.1 Cys/Met metabolism PLP-dependent enzyme [Mongoliibacter ruber]
MNETKVLKYIEDVIANMPSDWIKLTTHRLDIYNESLAKSQFLDEFEALFENNISETSALHELPTAYDYIRLGHPLSSVLEWAVAKLNGLQPAYVISFSSTTIPILAILRKNLFDHKNTLITYSGKLPDAFEPDVIKSVYGYNFDLKHVESLADIPEFEGSTVFVSQDSEMGKIDLDKSPAGIDFFVNIHAELGSVLVVNGQSNENYISEIQHVRRRETIAMTPVNCFSALKMLTGKSTSNSDKPDVDKNKALVLDTIRKITGADTKALLASSGLSMQYAIMMGLIHDAVEKHAFMPGRSQGKPIKIIVPPNCYGGTNDQARRVAACLDNVEILDLLVDRDHDMVQSIDSILNTVAEQDAVAYIIAEIPTNPRVEVPDLNKLREVLSAKRKTASGEIAIDPVFILDQTFCPNLQFLGEADIFSSIRTISYVSGSKFPSGGKCTAGYCVANKEAEPLLEKIEKHLILCDNEATAHQVEILAAQLPSMNQRIKDAYKNTREFVEFVKETLPEAKINFVSEELAQKGFTPSVFSLDLPSIGNTDEEREAYKRVLNLKLINMMINEIPNEGKYCVSYGQLKGSYWTIPATSTQGTTKEGDKDYIVRAALSPNMDLELHKKVFSDFVKENYSKMVFPQ